MPHQSSVSRSRDDAEFYAQLERPLHVEMARVRNSAWVQLDGELEFATAADAEAAIVSATALMRSVTIDLRGLEFIDSSGMALLVRASRRARQLGVTLTVIAGAGPVTQLLRTCGIDRQIALMEAGDALPRPTA